MSGVRTGSSRPRGHARRRGLHRGLPSWGLAFYRGCLFGGCLLGAPGGLRVLGAFGVVHRSEGSRPSDPGEATFPRFLPTGLSRLLSAFVSLAGIVTVLACPRLDVDGRMCWILAVLSELISSGSAHWITTMRASPDGWSSAVVTVRLSKRAPAQRDVVHGGLCRS
jgi:hypothetical protein